MYGPRFTDPYLYLKFAESVTLSDPATGDIVYYSNKPTDVNINPSVSMGEIRAGVGNPVVAVIPSDTNLPVEITAADFSLKMRAYQAGALHGYGAPTLICADIQASGTSITVPVATYGTPVAGQGFDAAYCYVQTVGAGSKILSDGVSYPISSAGVISNFTASSGTTYKVWFWVNKASTEYTTLTSIFDPAVLNCRVTMPVFANEKGASTQNGTRIGTLVIVIPYLKLGANAGVVGSSSANSTTSISGMAISYDEAVIQAGCNACADAAANLAHYLYVPCDDSDMIEGMYILGGVVELPKSSSEQVYPKLEVNGASVTPDPAFLSYELTGAPSGTTVSSSGLISSGSTAGSGTLTVTYTEPGSSESITCTATVTVSA